MVWWKQFSFEDDYNKNVLMAILMTESLEEHRVKAQRFRYLLRLAKRYIINTFLGS